ncbi:PAS domain-containing protein [Halovenus salina]|uniref:PAS domain S-box protein n=1 Tax=Halovenus salina TaxID=1510225 RepID=A0ABD5W4K8_9EURY|nr:PAS domain S-box protein [Halovenus salina]
MITQSSDSSTILNSIADGVVVRDAETWTIERVNDAFCEMVEYERQALIGTNVGKINAGPPPEETDSPEELIHQARIEGSVTFEWHIETKTQEILPVEIHLSFLDDEERLVATVREIQARKRHQQRLKRYKRLVEQAPGMMAALKTDRTFLFANEKFRQTHDISDQSVAGLTVEDVLSTERKEKLQPVLDSVLAGDTVNRTIQITTQEGNERWYHIQSYPLEHRGERVDSVVVTIDDVTDQERHRQTVRNQQAFIQSTFDALEDVFYVFDTEGTLVEYNDRLPEVTGYDSDELADMHPWDFFPPDERTQIKHVVSKVLHNGSDERTDGHLLTSSGTSIPYEFSGAPYYDGHGEVAGLVGIGRDITERQERERELTRFKEAIEQTGHAVCFTDTEGIIKYVNPAFEDLTEYSRDEVRGESPSIIQSGEHGDEFYHDLWETITDGQVWEGTIIDQRKSGTQYRAHQTIAPVTHEGSTLGFVSVQNEITDEKLRKEHISVMSRILRHNLRNYLNIIYVHAQQLQHSQSEDIQQSHVQKIIEQAEKLESLSEKIRAGRKILEQLSSPFDTVPVSELYEDVVTSVDEEALDATITFKNLSEEPVYVAEQLKPALRELLENALRHSENGAPSVTVQVQVATETERVGITIADNGPGIPKSISETLQQGRETDLQHLTGVGLWIVRWIVTGLGGTLEIETSDVPGSRVTLTTPLDPSQIVENQ